LNNLYFNSLNRNSTKYMSKLKKMRGIQIWHPYVMFLCFIWIFEFLMLVFKFYVSSVISRTNEIYIEKIINNSKKSKKRKNLHTYSFMSNTNESYYCWISKSLSFLWKVNVKLHTHKKWWYIHKMCPTIVEN
jgi:hypothetical protein